MPIRVVPYAHQRAAYEFAMTAFGFAKGGDERSAGGACENHPLACTRAEKAIELPVQQGISQSDTGTWLARAWRAVWKAVYRSPSNLRLHMAAAIDWYERR
ncbi:hypothetical protein AGMMS49992_11690 [Clostridia bacterium]|nr:hypothetical protein AGMMS49992_11690 [Clostridia bacterium]